MSRFSVYISATNNLNHYLFFLIFIEFETFEYFVMPLKEQKKKPTMYSFEYNSTVFRDENTNARIFFC
jgi:hypothetical protein